MRFERQIRIIESGKSVVQETRLYDSVKKTRSMRSKEDAHDYRYFPDPDLKPLILTQERIDALKSSSLESYNEKMNIYINQYKLSKDDSEVLLSNKSLAKFFDKTLDFIKDPMITSKWTITEIIKYIGLDTFNLKEENFAKFLQAVKEGKINNNSGKELLENLVVSNEDVDVLIDSLDLKQESSEDLLNEVIDKVLENNPDEKKRLLDGELKLLSFFMGQVMRETKGKGNPTVVGDIIRKRFNIS